MGITMTFAMAAMMIAMTAGALMTQGSRRQQHGQAQTATENCCAASDHAGSSCADMMLFAAADQNESKSAEQKSAATPKPAYPIDYCVVSGEKLGEMGEPVTKMYDGREVKFCCDMCPAKFEKDQDKFLTKLDDAIIAKQKPDYPLETCIVSGEEFGGEMGDPVDFVYGNQYFKLCCNACIKNIKKDPEKYLEKLSAAYNSTEGVSPADSNGKGHERQDGHGGHQH